ncbi:MAG: threonine--tRNA ligase [Candidatus Odinarchaeum yellowstonii]|uniref:threonine--tRNA ligase n=1 Tax=Odinarchaeota yellowstonii (strain LCB_4) TaxID=1841599 RepID=A0AAF0D301_ODILC|nr:MAG: threonine--tRNA ligase [Candidatus Odinarchaeum yellowstonii]
MPSRYLIINDKGEEFELDLKHIDDCPPVKKDPELRQYIVSEEIGGLCTEPPKHIQYLRQLELVDYEPASDVGHFRWYPKGAFLKSLIEEYAAWASTEWLNAIRIETPLMYRYDEPDIKEQADKFVEKDYRLKIGKRTLLLRFAGDFGLFKMMRDAQISYKQMPVRVFELSPSFRLEKRGECVGLRRLRAFTMPDLHCFCKDFNQGFEEYVNLTKFYHKLLTGLSISYVLVFRVVKKYFEEYKEFLKKLITSIGKTAFIDILPSMKHYWALKSEYQVIDSVGGNAQLSTVQLDVEDAERYGIRYADEDGGKKGCIILHSSMGSVERVIYALLETALKNKTDSKLPSLPVWLSPTQVRLIPVADRHISFAERVQKNLEENNIRADIDDRDKSIGKKILDAEKRDWTPYIVILGDKEVESGKLTVRNRLLSSEKKPHIVELSLEEFINTVKKETEGRIHKRIPLPVKLSARPSFT